MVWIKPLLFVSIAVALGTARASALSIVPNPVSFSNGFNVEGSLELIDVVTGLPSGDVAVQGVVGASDTTLVFQLHVVTGPFNNLGVLRIRLAEVGTSFSTVIPPTAIGAIGPDFDLFPNLNGNFQGGVLAGTTSNPIFVSYRSPVATDGSLELRYVVGSGVTFVVGTAAIVPEPGTTLLLAIGGVLATAWSARSGRIV